MPSYYYASWAPTSGATGTSPSDPLRGDNGNGFAQLLSGKVPGDVLHLARGSVYRWRSGLGLWLVNRPGLTIRAYDPPTAPAGTDLTAPPQIDARLHTLTTDWSADPSGHWVYTGPVALTGNETIWLHPDQIPTRRAASFAAISATTPWFYGKATTAQTTNRLYLLATSNPVTLYGSVILLPLTPTASLYKHALNVQDSSDLRVEDLDLAGGNQSCARLSASAADVVNIHLDRVRIVRNNPYNDGLLIAAETGRTLKHVTLDRLVIDPRISPELDVFAPSLNGGADGLLIKSGVQNLTLRRSYLRNCLHTSLAIVASGNASAGVLPTQAITLEDNVIDVAGGRYARPLSIAGNADTVRNITVRANQCLGASLAAQIGGANVLIENNLFDMSTSSETFPNGTAPTPPATGNTADNEGYQCALLLNAYRSTIDVAALDLRIRGNTFRGYRRGAITFLDTVADRTLPTKVHDYHKITDNLFLNDRWAALNAFDVTIMRGIPGEPQSQLIGPQVFAANRYVTASTAFDVVRDYSTDGSPARGINAMPCHSDNTLVRA